jgi:hypothetical protein
VTKNNVRLGEVEPRERAGAQTGRKYEYQYERTARAALDLLADGTPHICVYCDWHDDYVTEVGNPPTRYLFHQVKGRKSSQGPWTFREFFGVSRRSSAKPAKQPAIVADGAIVPLLIAHHKTFAANCAGVFFVTNAGLHPELSVFLTELSAVTTENELALPAQFIFQHIARAYVAAKPPIATSSADLLQLIRTLRVKTDQGHVEDHGAALLEIADVVVSYSEIDLVLRQAKQIAREIISHVRGKVSHSVTAVPASDEQLRKNKGILVVDLLNVLSLSASAYEELKAGEGRDSVKTLSRLQRFCKKRQGFATHLTQICQFKAQWDIWRTIERHFLSSADYLLLQNKASELVNSGMTLERIISESTDIAQQFAGHTATPLKAEHVLGLVFALAAETEAIK